MIHCDDIKKNVIRYDAFAKNKSENKYTLDRAGARFF